MARARTKRPANAVTATIQTLESLSRSGVKQLPRSGKVPPQPPAGAARRPGAGGDTPRAGGGEQRSLSLPPALAAVAGDTLEAIRSEVAACMACRELAQTRTQTVFGVGNPHARLCFLGEAPGADEDAQGEPFVGRAGQLLTKIIEACTLSRADVYILNILKCRPPGNRNPLPEEAANCRGFLDRQLALIQPEFLCCLGSVAAQNLLDTVVPISRLRGRLHDYHGIPVLCTYHPAYLLRNPAAKKDVWDDMKILMHHMGIELPQSGKGGG